MPDYYSTPNTFSGSVTVGGDVQVYGNITSGPIVRPSVTFTAGTYNDFDTTDIDTIFCDTSGGDIIINGMTGILGQVVYLVRTSSGNSLKVNRASASATGYFFLTSNGSTLDIGPNSGAYGGTAVVVVPYSLGGFAWVDINIG